MNPAINIVRKRCEKYIVSGRKLSSQLTNVTSRTWDLGFTSFGGPPVHFQILYRRFVKEDGRKVPWVDEQTYHELFALTQALPGPASTKMLFCMALIHAGLLPAVVVFLLWSLPGAIGMFGLASGVQHMSDVLPEIVYALLSGLNAATVGIIALAAVQLAELSIKDDLARILVIFGACAGLCYNALWYFPVLILSGGITTTIWDLRLRALLARVRRYWRREQNARSGAEAGGVDSVEQGSSQSTVVALQRSETKEPRNGLHRRAAVSSAGAQSLLNISTHPGSPLTSQPEAVNATSESTHAQPNQSSMLSGGLVIGVFSAIFIGVMVARGVITTRSREFDVFANMFLAGTIIFGGGPVVIPLLRSYVVEPGWVSSRDFLIGLALIQAFPGPNFNFAVYLGALAFVGTNTLPLFGSVLGLIGIFTPGLMLSVGIHGFWNKLRTKPAIIALLRGINATAVGMTFTAVYRLWQIGYLTPQDSRGQSLASEPWWVVVAVIAYAGSAWFHVPAALAIAVGPVLGLVWHGVVSSHWSYRNDSAIM